MMQADANWRPQTGGDVSGQVSLGVWAATEVTWVVDTGAALPVISDDVASQFIFTTVAISAGQLVTGPISATDDLIVGFDTDYGREHVATTVGIRHDDIDENLLGMSALRAAGATVCWDPATSSGALY